MNSRFSCVRGICLLFAILCSFFSPILAQEKSGSGNEEKIKQFINFKPVQSEIDIDTPAEAELKTCSLEKVADPAGVVVRDPSGRTLRRFLDTDANKKYDQFSYYKSGVEVYREVDANGDSKPDEFRWFGPGGTRWGIDRDADNKIDAWKRISAEEVGMEIFYAIRSKDAKRFDALMLTPGEYKSMKVGELIGKEVDRRWKLAKSDFLKFCESQKAISEGAKYVHTANGNPALIAANSFSNENEILLYDNASVVFQDAKEQYGNISVGSIVEVASGVWRVVELPEIASSNKPIVNGGAFFPTVAGTAGGTSTDQPEQNKRIVEIHSKLDVLEKKVKETAKASEAASLEQEKAGLLEELWSETAAGEQKKNAMMYVADSVVTSYQEDRFPDGLKFLEGFAQRVKGKQTEGVDYIKWRVIQGRYNYANMKGNNEERDKAHERWLAELMDFQKEFPKSVNSAEAMSYLAINFDNEGKEKESIEWYTKIVDQFPDTPQGKRAKGAIVRLDGQGDKLTFVGMDTKGNKFDLQDAKWRDKVVVIHFWETWSTDGLEKVQQLVEKYKDNDVLFVGCNIDVETKKFEDYMKEHPEYGSWLQLHAPGSIEASPLAHQLGVPSLPLVVIVNKKGELAEPMVVFADLDRQVERQRRR